MRAFAAVFFAFAVCAAAPVFADAQTHVTAARKAEKRHDWKKALTEWKAAYAQDMNAEYLIGIGDAYAHLGNTAEAKKSYEAYLADPLALPRNVEKVKSKIAALEPAPGSQLALPGAALPLPAAKAAAPPPLPLPGLDQPAAPATAAKKSEPPMLELPGAKKEPAKVATATVPELPLPGAKTDAKKDAAVAAGAAAAKPITMTTPVAPLPASTAAPIAATSTTPMPHSTSASSGVQRTMAYVTAGVAVVALGGGAYAYTQANTAQNDLNGSVHSGAEAAQLLQKASQNKTLAFVGLAGGLALAGVSAALFAF